LFSATASPGIAALGEDAEDIAAFEERANEPLISFSEKLKRLNKDGRI